MAPPSNFVAYRFVGDILNAADEVSVSAVLNGHVEREGSVEIGRGCAQLLLERRWRILSAAANFSRC